METQVLNQNFIDSLKERLPQKELANALVDLLIIEKEAVYRRLRGEVPFTFAEIAKISRKFNLSIDTIVRTTSEIDKPFLFKVLNHYNQTESDYEILREYIDAISTARNSKYSESGLAMNILPVHSLCYYENIERFYILVWLYQMGDKSKIIPYDQIKIPERKRQEVNKKFEEELKQIQYTYIIWDRLVLFYLINDIHFFYKIRLINDDDMILLKKEIEQFIEDIDKVCIHGAYFDTGNKVDMYVSNLSFESAYSYLETSELHITFIKTFTMNETYSYDEVVFGSMKEWLKNLKKTSVLISGSNEVYRMKFIEKQRYLVDKMFDKNFDAGILYVE